MALPNDITLNGVGYALVPDGYRKRNAPATAAVNPRDVRRLTLGPFGRGQRQAVDSRSPAADSRLAAAGWDSVGVAPCFDGQGIEPFPHVAAFGDSMSDTPSATNRVHGVIAGSNAFFGIGRRIYKSVALTSGTWSALTAAADLGAGFAISGLAYYQDDLLVMLSTGQDIRKFNTATNALTVWRSGEKGQVGCGYKGQLVYAPRTANAQEELRLSGTRWNGNAVTHLRYLDSPIVTMALFNGRVAIATRTSLYLLSFSAPIAAGSTPGWPGGWRSTTTVRSRGAGCAWDRRGPPAAGRRWPGTGSSWPSPAAIRSRRICGDSMGRGGGCWRAALRRPPSGPVRWAARAAAT
jgi:hypothetical protein